MRKRTSLQSTHLTARRSGTRTCPGNRSPCIPCHRRLNSYAYASFPLPSCSHLPVRLVHAELTLTYSLRVRVILAALLSLLSSSWASRPVRAGRRSSRKYSEPTKRSFSLSIRRRCVLQQLIFRTTIVHCTVQCTSIRVIVVQLYKTRFLLLLIWFFALCRSHLWVC